MRENAQIFFKIDTTLRAMQPENPLLNAGFPVLAGRDSSLLGE